MRRKRQGRRTRQSGQCGPFLGICSLAILGLLHAAITQMFSAEFCVARTVQTQYCLRVAILSIAALTRCGVEPSGLPGLQSVAQGLKALRSSVRERRSEIGMV